MLVTAMCEPHGVLGCEQCAMPVVEYSDLDHGWRCMVCGDNDRPFDMISVAHRPPRPEHGGFGHWNVSYCNDRPTCVAAATAPGPWPARLT